MTAPRSPKYSLPLSVVTLLILFLLTACQSTLSGSVRDQNGPVPGAIVRVQTTEIFTTTADTGEFRLVDLPGGEPFMLTAWAPGYYIVRSEASVSPGADTVELVLVPHAATDNPDYSWLSANANAEDPGNCQNCHADAEKKDSALPFDEWVLDAHSSSTQNPRFLTTYLGTDMDGNRSPITRKGYSRDYGSFPLLPDPAQPYFGPGYKLDFPGTAGNCAACHAPTVAIQEPYGLDPTTVTGVGTEGVACDFCHKIWDVKLDSSGLPHPYMPGVLSYEFRRPEKGHQFFAGPYDDVAPGEDTYSPLQEQAQFCAPCHFGFFWDTLIYNSYGEWLDSPYSDPETGQTCQDCHMPAGRTDHFVRFDAGGLVRDPTTIFSHRMPGASDEALLQNAVSLSANAWREGGEIMLAVEIANDKTGHHIPTDSPLRQLILVIRASDAQEKPLAQLSGSVIPDYGGVGEPAQGYYAGLPGTIYAKILQELWTEATPTGAYWNPTQVLSDNRIAALETDKMTYRFAAPLEGDANLYVTLIYRRAFITLIEQKGWDAPDILIAEHTLKLP